MSANDNSVKKTNILVFKNGFALTEPAFHYPPPPKGLVEHTLRTTVLGNERCGTV